MKNNAFGKNLKNLRLDKNLTQREFGKQLGFANQTVSGWESNISEPNYDTLLLISKFFNVSIDDLLSENMII